MIKSFIELALVRLTESPKKFRYKVELNTSLMSLLIV